MAKQSDIGLIGLAVMGQNLVLNMADHGFQVAAYNRTTSKVDGFLAGPADGFLAGPAQGKSIVGCRSLEEFVQSLKKPRIAMLMVKAGDPVKKTVKQLGPLMETGDIIIDGGNSYFRNTEQMIRELEPLGILYMGTGISGGEEGARHGPSIMPGGANPFFRQ
jgi:6-phosphogluconate dehydrogenase